MKKIIKSILAFFIFAILAFVFFAFCFSRSASAVDLTVTCEQEGPCNMSPTSGAALFYEENIFPGYSVTRKINFENKDTRYACPLLLGVKNPTQTPADFATKLFTEIKDDATTLYGGGSTTLNDLYGAGAVSLGNIPVGGTKVYDWTVNFDPLTGNTYQSAKTVFDFDLVFSCGAPVSPTATPGPGASPTPTPTPSGCTATAPTSAPSLSVTTTSPNTVLLTWTSVPSVTHYTIVYGIAPGSPIYGAVNVGNVTSYTVSGLSGGVTYYFQVAGVNDCVAGPWSNEAGATPAGVYLGIGPATGFEVLGVSTPSAELKGEGTEEIKGEKISCVWWRYLWWLPLVFQALLIFVYYHWFKGQKVTAWWLVPVLLSLLSQLVHEILGCWCSQSKWCPWYWLFNLIILLIMTLYYWWRKKRQSPDLTSE